ncbi:MAG: cephalosporin hydroxylase family protein, partial [Thermoleophilia bacterium]|nr:cephalosporin hydroxylase family protein [Thermoleophilia bacterium]
AHPRVTYLGGRSSTDPGVLREVARRSEGRRTMVLLDSNHSRDHVVAELNAYAPFVSPGGYLIVEDSNIGVVRRDLLPGPMEALRAFLEQTRDFEVDRTREKHHITFNPSGYLRRIDAAPSRLPKEAVPAPVAGR